MRSAIYTGHVVHARAEPAANAFRYRTCFVRIDLAELPELARRLRLFTHGGRWRPTALRDEEYLGGGAGGAPLRNSVLAWIAGQVDVDLPADGELRVELVTSLRMLGYSFNPISCFYVWEAGASAGDPERLRWLVAEVHSTFGERHRYLLDVTGAGDGAPLVVEHDKQLHVSPFLPMDRRYRFRVRAPGERFSLGVDVLGGARTFTTAWTGTARPFTDRGLLHLLLRYPFAPLVVTARIHLQALRLFRRRVPLIRKPPFVEGRGTTTITAEVPRP